MNQRPVRVLVFGAHPDDCDVKSGGLAALYARRGDVVRMVSLTNGDAGHHEIGGAPLAWIRRREAEAAGATLGVEYLVLDHHDGELEPTLDVRHEVIGLIREFRPDVVICPRPWDYHPDHRATGQLVVDALYLCTVPNAVSAVPHLRSMPVALYMMDGFTRPCPFQGDIVIDIDAVWETKVDALACHTSQVYEWLPYNRGELDRVPAGEVERRRWLGEFCSRRFSGDAARFRDGLVARYGEARGQAVRYCEAYEITEYGAPMDTDTAARLLPF